MLGAISCLFLMYYLPPTSWWRFVAWLMLGLSVYLSYGYARSELGRKTGRPSRTESWLTMLAIGSFLIAVGLLAIPHGASFGELYSEMTTAGGKRSMFALGCLGFGVLFAVIGLILGSMKSKTEP
jgi:phosphatidylglycerophosphate synthase